MNVYRAPPNPLPSLRDMIAEGKELALALGADRELFLTERMNREYYPPLDAHIDATTRETLTRDRAARAPCPAGPPEPISAYLRLVGRLRDLIADRPVGSVAPGKPVFG